LGMRSVFTSEFKPARQQKTVRKSVLTRLARGPIMRLMDSPHQLVRKSSIY
jgi:hypothetical protein